MNNKISRHYRYCFFERVSFKHELDNAHFYVMEDYNIGIHKQEFFEINIITRGAGLHYIENNCISAARGDVFIIPPDLEHAYEGGIGFDVFHITISNKFMRRNATELQLLPGFFMLFSIEPLMRAKTAKPLHLKLTENQFNNIQPLLDKMLLHDKYEDITDSIIRTGLLTLIIAQLCKIYSEDEAVCAYQPMVDENFMKAVFYIHERYFEKITLADLAKISRLSRSAFLQKFEDVCKMTPAQYVIKRRLDVAENLLANTNLTVSDIAFKTGFYDISHFSKIFTAKIGCTPAQYRKRR